MTGLHWCSHIAGWPSSLLHHGGLHAFPVHAAAKCSSFTVGSRLTVCSPRNVCIAICQSMRERRGRVSRAVGCSYQPVSAFGRLRRSQGGGSSRSVSCPVIIQEKLQMLSLQNHVLVSRVLVPLLGPVIWSLLYLLFKLAYRSGSWQKILSQILLITGICSLFLLQVELMVQFAPEDVHSNYFPAFLLIEGVICLGTMLYTLFRERARSLKSGTDRDR